jgi:hypothetical protein
VRFWIGRIVVVVVDVTVVEKRSISTIVEATTVTVAVLVLGECQQDSSTSSKNIHTA